MNKSLLCRMLLSAIVFCVIVAAILAVDNSNLLSSIGIVNSNTNIAMWTSVIAAATTIGAVSLTIKAQEKVRAEDRAAEVLPLIKMKVFNGIVADCATFVMILKNAKKPVEKQSKDNITSIFFEIKNVGVREMYNLVVGDLSATNFETETIQWQLVSHIVLKNDRVFIRIQFVDLEFDGDKDNLYLQLRYKDCYGSWYTQSVLVELAIDSSEKQTNVNGVFNIGGPQRFYPEKENFPWA